MIKPFYEALRDGFKDVRQITDKVLLSKLRNEGIAVDSEAIKVYDFGDRKEYSLKFEPFGEDGEYLVALYKHEISLIPKIHIKGVVEKH